jgi:NAD(P)-dependent dehydrogenase (short-subunit alcohol dehydrogenase family)
MPKLSRRTMLAASGGVAAISAAPAAAQPTAPPNLKGKSFLVTGTSSGFGRLGALLYARSGARVFATMRNLPRPEADELRRIAREEKLDLHVLPLDVRSDEQVARAVAEAERINGGPLDVLVNNAGVVIGGPVEVHDMEAVQLAFDTNVYGPHRLARAVLPAMRARKSGVIVNVSSQQGRVINPGSGVYSGTKFALEALSEQMAYELAPHGIEVVIIEPGGFPTNVGANRARYQRELAQRVPAKHAEGYPEMMAGLNRALPSGPRPNTPARPLSPEAAAYLAADPIMVPQAIAEIAAMPAGSRPLRRPVHPGNKPQLEINRVASETQLRMLGSGPYAPWAKAVLD